MYLFEFLDGGLLALSWWQLVLATLLLTHLTIAGVTIYLHRSQAHRGVDLHPVAAHGFRLWLWLTTGMQTKEWVAIHRKHHAKCETADDPHSPQTRGLRKVLYLLARLARDLRRAYAQELARMRLPAHDRRRFAALRRWLRSGDVSVLPAAQRQTLREVLGRSRAIRMVVEMRAELLATWDRSSASREQALVHLQDWIARAEASGIHALQNAAIRIRSYAPAGPALRAGA